MSGLLFWRRGVCLVGGVALLGAFASGGAVRADDPCDCPRAGRFEPRFSPSGVVYPGIANPADQPVGVGEFFLRRLLKQPTQIEFIETPLQDVVEYLKDFHNIEMQIDKRALDDAGLGTDTPITLNAKGLPLHSALDVILHEHDLTFVVHDGYLWITTAEEAARLKSIRLYPVSDLIEEDGSSAVLEKAVRVALDEAAEQDQQPTEAGFPRIATFRGQLVVFATQGEHRRVNQVLNGLRRALDLKPAAERHPLANLRGCKELYLGFPTLRDDDLAYLEDATELEVLDLSGSAITDEGLAHLAGLTGLKKLSLARTDVRRAGVKQLDKLVNLEYLDLHGTQVDGAVAYYFREMPNLRWLNLGRTRARDTTYLPGLKALEHLCLGYTEVDDEGVEQLSRMTNLKALNLDGTPLTDAALEHLGKMKGLKELYLRRQWLGDEESQPAFTVEGAEKLREALPECEIVGLPTKPEPAKEPSNAAPDPFGVEPAQPPADPFGGGGADPFGGGAEPAPAGADPFGGGGGAAPAPDEDPFGQPAPGGNPFEDPPSAAAEKAGASVGKSLGKAVGGGDDTPPEEDPFAPAKPQKPPGQNKGPAPQDDPFY